MKKRVLLLFGGESSEHNVSLASVRNVFSAIDESLFDITLGYIDKQGRWWLVNSLSIRQQTENEQLLPLLGCGEFTTVKKGLQLSPDVILPILHGKNGEDGSVQALGQLLHIPVVGCDMTSSAICMDKVATKEVLSANGLPVVPFRIHRKGEADISFDKLKKQLGEQIFVKPARSGSSVGVSKVISSKQLIGAVGQAHEHDNTVIIEEAVVGRELEVAALGTPPHHKVSGVGEIIAGEEFYSYDDKYSPDSKSQVVIPAELDKSVQDEISSLAHKVYEVLGCRGMARIDFFLGENGKVFINEVNTIPGFTNISMYPKLWQQQGLSYSDLISRLILDALGDTM